MDNIPKETTTQTPSCLLCSSQKNYCFNSPADVFGLIEINQRKKRINRWLDNLLFLEHTKVDKNLPIFICEVHYNKEDLIREIESNGTCSVKLINHQTVPCFVKLEDRALNNRINSFLFLKEEFEMCLDLGKIWVANHIKNKLILILKPKRVEIQIEENLVVTLCENNSVLDMKFAIDAGYIESNKRILFWSRLRGLMKYFEDKNSYQSKIVIADNEPTTFAMKIKEEPVDEEPLVKFEDEIKASQVILKRKNEEESLSEQKPKIFTKKIEFDPPVFKIMRGITMTKIVSGSDTNVDKCAVKMNNTNLPTLKITYIKPVQEHKTSDSVNHDIDIIDRYSSVTTIFKSNLPPNWNLIINHLGTCAIKIETTPSKAYILKSIKAEKSISIKAYINGKPVINHIINKIPGKVSKKGLISLIQSIDRVPIKLPQGENSFELDVKQEKIDLHDFYPGVIASFDILVDNLEAFAGNDWFSKCMSKKNVLIFKVDISSVPKFKRYININRNLQVTIVNNDQIIELHKLFDPEPFVLYPLTVQKIHKIMVLLDETVFDKILRPSKYRPKHFNRNWFDEDDRVVEGTKKKHKCSICEYESNTLNYVKQHYEIKHTPPDRKCPECGKEMNKTQLKVHARFHIKKVKCPVCNKGFADSRDLKKHINVHSKGKEFNISILSQIKPLSVRNNQQQLNYEDNGIIFKNEPLVEIKEIANAAHPLFDICMDQTKIKVEKSDDMMEGT